MNASEKNTHLKLAFEKAKRLEPKTMIRITAEPVSYFIMMDQDGEVFIGYPIQETSVKKPFYKSLRAYAQVSTVDGSIVGYWQPLIKMIFNERP